MGRAATAILSTEHLLHNLAVVKQHASGARVMAMVKANAYGHGLRSVSLRLDKYVDGLGVASVDEALALRRVGVKAPIVLMEGVFEPEELLVASCEHFQDVFHEHTQLQWLRRASLLPRPLTAWIKVDTGLGRLGFTIDELARVHGELAASPCIKQPIGLMSHFACAEMREHELTLLQKERFARYASAWPGPRSLCNSAGVFQHRDDHYDLVRPGIALYGVSPLVDRSASDLGLRPVMTLQTRLIAVRRANAGTSLGYGARYTCPEDMPVGVIAMGYGDGIPRGARDGTPVLVNGIRCQLVGRVSMDMITIDLRPCPTAQVGDPVVLWGEGLPLEEVAAYTDSSPYDIMTAVQPRVKFHWTRAD